MSTTSRRTVLAGAAAGATLATLSGTMAKAVGTTPKDTTIASMQAGLDLDYGVAVAYSKKLNTTLAAVFPEGIGAPCSVVDLKNKKVLSQVQVHVGYDRVEAYCTTPEGHMILMSGGYRMMVVDNATGIVKKIAVGGSNPRATAPYGQLSTFSYGPLNQDGTRYLYLGDFQSTLGRYTIPKDIKTATNTWYNFGKPFAGSNIGSVKSFKGYLYVGVQRGSHAGLYRISEATLNAVASAGKTLTKADFLRIDLNTAAENITDDKLLFPQILATTVGKNLLHVRYLGWKMKTVDVDTIKADGTATLGATYLHSQTLVEDPDGKTLWSREGYQGTHYLISLDGSAAVPNKNGTSKFYHGKLGLGALCEDHLIDLRPDGKRYVYSCWQEKLNETEIGKGTATITPWLTTGFTEWGKELLPPAGASQLGEMALLPGYMGRPERVVYAPYWINDFRVGVVDVATRKTKELSQPLDPRKNYFSSQVESFNYYKGDVIVGTYTNGGVFRLNPNTLSGDRGSSEKLISTGIDQAPARTVVQQTMSDGKVILGYVASISNPEGSGLGVYTPPNAAIPGSTGTLKVIPAKDLIPNHNIVTLERIPATATTPEQLIVGTNTWIEEPIGAPEKPYDAQLWVFNYSNGYFSSPRRISLPAGIKTVWGVKRMSNGRIFAIVQFANTQTPTAEGVPTPAANRLIELNPKTLAPLPVVNGAGNIGTYIYPTTYDTHGRTQMIELSPTKLLIRVNVFIYTVNLKPSAGVYAPVPVPGDGGKGALTTPRIDVSPTTGKWYFLANEGYVIERTWV